MVEHVLIHGKPGGRRAASEALAEFHGAQANARALAALGDEDPQVQANVIVQLRRRGIPGALARLVELADSPHVVVRQAVRQSLDEFTFERYVGVFDTLDEQSQRTTGMLVKKIDPQAIALLRQELASKMRTRRLRALRIVRAIDAIDAMEPLVIDALEDEDHLVRLEAVGALAESDSQAATEALRRALEDRGQTVADAARRDPPAAGRIGPPGTPTRRDGRVASSTRGHCNSFCWPKRATSRASAAGPKAGLAQQRAMAAARRR